LHPSICSCHRSLSLPCCRPSHASKTHRARFDSVYLLPLWLSTFVSCIMSSISLKQCKAATWRHHPQSSWSDCGSLGCFRRHVHNLLDLAAECRAIQSSRSIFLRRKEESFLLQVEKSLLDTPQSSSLTELANVITELEKCDAILERINEALHAEGIIPRNETWIATQQWKASVRHDLDGDPLKFLLPSEAGVHR